MGKTIMGRKPVCKLRGKYLMVLGSIWQVNEDQIKEDSGF